MNASAWLYPMWRWHIWQQGRGETYETIDRKVERGLLTPGVCDCGDPDCRWTPSTLARPNDREEAAP